MGIRINMGYTGVKTDYSYLFQSMSGGNSNLNFLSDYASIKNGSYGKLMKAYYAKDSKIGKEASSIVQSKQNLSVSKDSTETLEKVNTSAESLKSSADKLTQTGKDSVFNKEQSEIYSAVNSFVSDYNKLVKEADNASSDSITKRADTMKFLTESNRKLLGQVGITIGEDDTLSLDKDAFAKADQNTVKTLFNGNHSYASRVSSQSSFIESAVKQEAAKANTYTGNGTYSNAYNSGNLFNTYF